jgi:hypothetical protein
MADITSRNWQLDASRIGEVVQGLDDVAQCIQIILETRKGTDPLRPDFGCGIYEYVDKPVNLALPDMLREITNAIATYEQRVNIIRILHAVEANGTLKFTIEWELTGAFGETIFQLS